MFSEIRHRLRSLSRAPLFAAVVIATLGVGIGASTAVFGIVDRVLLRPLPFPDEDRLTWIGELFNRTRLPGSVSYRTFAEIRDRADSFEAVALGRGWAPSVESDQNAELLTGSRVSHSYFTVMGVRPALGRFFTPEEDMADGPQVVVLGHGLWHRRFGADPNVLGRELRLAGDTYEVIGVAPEAWNHSRLAWTEIWTTLRLDDAKERTNIGRNSTMVARLKENRFPGDATAEVATIMRQIAAAFPDTHHPADSAVVLHARESVVGQSRAPLFLLFGAVALVLLVSCANAANLLLSRASARQQEIAVRSALGAGRRRLLSEWLIEGGLLAAGGAVVGVGLAWAASRGVLVASPAALPRLDTVGIDAGTLVFAAGAATLAGVLVVIPAAVRSTRPDHAEHLRASARTTTPIATRRMHHALIIAEIGAALVLVVGLALLGRSFARLLAVPVGFDGTSVLTMQLTLPAAAYDTAQSRARFFQNVLANVRTVPGVTAAGSARLVPLVPRSTSDSIIVEGRPIPRRGEQMVIVRENVVSPGYFSAIGIPLVRGRDFSEEGPGHEVGRSSSIVRWPSGCSRTTRPLAGGSAPATSGELAIPASPPFRGSRSLASSTMPCSAISTGRLRRRCSTPSSIPTTNCVTAR